MDTSDAEEPFRDFVRAQPRRQPEKFTGAMRTFLLSQVMERWSVVTDSRIDDRAVYNKRRAWTAISSQFNAKFPNTGKTVQQLKDLWKRHSIQFRKESREEMALEEAADCPAAGAVPNEVMFQKLLEWLESNPGEEGAEAGADELSPPDDEEKEPARKVSRQSEEPAEGVDVKEEPPPTPPRLVHPTETHGHGRRSVGGRRPAVAGWPLDAAGHRTGTVVVRAPAPGPGCRTRQPAGRLGCHQRHPELGNRRAELCPTNNGITNSHMGTKLK